MGRELKRVPLDFNWPVGLIWKGYINPYRYTECKVCDGSGYNKATRELEETWYSFADESKRWSDKLTQDEVDALVDKGRLMEWTRRPRTPEQFELLKAQATEDNPNPYWLAEPNGYRPTAEEINNAQNDRNVFNMHDCINRWICIETRAKRLGVWGHCELCNGKGQYFCEEKFQGLYENWNRIEPPKGEGYQIWETVSEGSAVSPVFEKPEDLAQWMVDNDTSVTKHTPFEQWMKFILGPGWAPSLVASPGHGVTTGVEAIE